MNSKALRQSFIDFFKSKQHEFAPGSPIVPDNDPTLLFINAGMNQFKDVFLGEGTRPYTRAVNSQICVRVSGKHNDLEDVGKDTTHLTSFEMLGNWSFGDYYKKEAIEWAWEFLTEVLKLNKDHLFVTIYEEDDEAGDLWRAHTDVAHDHIVKCGKKDNFWEMGDVGPCGPCSEIHIDLTPDDPNRTPNNKLTEVDLDGDRFIELWNLVFIQYNRTAEGSFDPLPAKHVDTGAGLERLASVLQGTLSNYQTDVFSPILDKIVEITGVPYKDDLTGMPHRVLADHIRTLSFGIADNVLPSNEGRGYVLRRLLRRALRYSKKLGVNEPILFKLVDSVVETLGEHFTHLTDRANYIKTVVKSEEDSFLKTLESGLEHFDVIRQDLQAKGIKTIPGDVAFKLYDTFGFPYDLTEVVAEESGLNVDKSGFDVALNKQREASRAATKSKQLDARETEARPEDEATAVINDTDLETLHQSEYTDNIARGGEARVILDSQNRIRMARHHTATHILHEAMRQVLGDHVQQAGSLVDIDRLRFDFTHFQAVTKEELEKIQTISNEIVQKNIPVSIHHMGLEEAKAKGAMALFGEKYDENDVRVVQMADFSTELCGGTHVKETGMIETIKVISESAVAAGTRRIEAIAGSENVNSFESEQTQKVISVVKAKLDRMKGLIAQLEAENQQPKVTYTTEFDGKSIEELHEIDVQFGNFIKEFEKELSKLKSQKANQDVQQYLNDAVELSDGTTLLVKSVEGFDVPMLHALTDTLINMKPTLFVIIGSKDGDKGTFLIKAGKDVDTSTYHAGNTIKELTGIAGGGGGGKPEKAQAGGAASNKVDDALAAIKEKLS
jgi:alanyl-tRNA synthetase